MFLEIGLLFLCTYTGTGLCLMIQDIENKKKYHQAHVQPLTVIQHHNYCMCTYNTRKCKMDCWF